jgi:uncharacterized MAPEG superfamily protein
MVQQSTEWASGKRRCASACMVYFLVRAAHYVVYAAAVPLVRTALFFTGFICQLILGAVLLGWIR